MVIFGASGDLTHRLLFPALYNLCRTGLVPQQFAVIGVAVDNEYSGSRAGREERGSSHADSLKKSVLYHRRGGPDIKNVVTE